VKEERNKVICF